MSIKNFTNHKGVVHIFFLFTIVVIGIAGIGYFAYQNGQIKIGIPNKTTSPIPTPSNNSTLYGSFDIPADKIPYPKDWPQDLHYPQQLELVHAQGSTEAGWEAALTYSGTAKEASDILENFFVNRGWVITDRTIVDDDNFGFFIRRDDNEGVIIIGSDPSTNTVKIVLTVYE